MENRQPVNPLPNTTVPGQTYGQGAAQERAMAAVPMGTPTPPPARPGGAADGGGLAPVVPLNAASTRPEEPVTSGLVNGMGPGPEVLGFGAGQFAQQEDTALAELRAAYLRSPSEHLRLLIEDLEAG